MLLASEMPNWRGFHGLVTLCYLSRGAYDADEWPPPAARLDATLWRAEGNIERGEYAQAARALEGILDAVPAEEKGFVRGLYHLAAAGYRADEGDHDRAARQLARAERRLAPFLPVHRKVDAAALLELVRTGQEP